MKNLITGYEIPSVFGQQGNYKAAHFVDYLPKLRYPTEMEIIKLKKQTNETN